MGKNSIAVKLAGGFGFCILCLAILVGSNYASLQKLENLYRDTQKHSAAMELAKDAQHIGEELGAIIGHAIINRDMAKSEKDWVAAKQEALTKLQEVAAVADTAEEQKLLSEARAAFADLISTYELEMLPLIRKGESVPGPLSEVDARLDSRIEAISLALDWIEKIESGENLTASREFHTLLRKVIKSSLTISLVGILAVLSIAILTIRRFVSPISELTYAAREMGKGNYRVDVKYRSDDEIGVLAGTFRQMITVVNERTSELEAVNSRLKSEIGIRKRAEEDVRALNADLEQKVSKRTAELSTAVVSLQQEILGRTKVETALRESEKLLRVVLEILPVGIWVRGSKGESIVMSNRAGKRIWCGSEYCDLEMTGEFKGWRQGTGKRLEKEEWALAKALSTGETTLNEIVEIECFDGSRKIIANSAVPIKNENNELIAAVEVVEDITARRQAEESLRISHEQLRNLSAHLESAREEEQSRIAREIHDELGQLLTVLRFDLSWLNGKIPAGEQALVEKLRSMSDLVDTTINTVRRVATDLRPAILDHLGLAAAIEWYVQKFHASSGIVCQLDIDTDGIAVDQRRTAALFRVCQEALTNVMRHAGASRVDVTLRLKGNQVQLHVSDNGIGIGKKALANPRSVGLTGMRERVHLLGGEMSISGVRGKGTSVMVTIPMNDKEETNDQDSHSG